ncbi:MAG: hypothetical protein GEV03_16125 [Streptosporangiales bacterium]|nr:hypothetical protein [Streptosporangiales bacterium]
MAETKRRGGVRAVRRPTRPLRADRVYLGWQYALLFSDPGPPPRRPTPPEQEGLNPAWVAAQRREENLLNRPLKVVVGAALGVAVLVLGFSLFGGVNPLLAAVLIVACLFVVVAAGYALWQGEHALRERIGTERRRLERIRTDQERKLFAAQREHAQSHQAWQDRKVAYDRQLQWYAVAVPDEVDRIDVAGGTLAGWSALVTMIGTSRMGAGGELTVLDLSEGAVAGDLVGLARRLGAPPQVWVLPDDLPRFDLGVDLDRDALADVLSLVVGVSEEHASTRDLSFDNAILERVLRVLRGEVNIRRLTAALRALAQVGDPRDDLREGLLTAEELDRIGTLFGRGATDRVVLERAWALESQLRKLEALGSEAAKLPPAQLRIVSVGRQGGVLGNKVLGTYAATALTHVLRGAPAGKPWGHTVCVCGADRLRGDVLDRLVDACEASRTGLVLCYRSIPQQVKERLGRGNAAVAFMRLGNADDAKIASEHIGTEHRFVLSQLTETVGSSVTETAGDSYTSTMGTSESTSSSASTSSSRGESRGRGRSDDAWLGLGDSTWSRSRDANWSYATTDSETFTEGITTSTAWGRSTSRAIGSNESLARTVQRSREFLVEQHELQRLPETALIISHSSPAGRRVVLADANPAIFSLPRSTVKELDEARRLAEARPVAHASDPGGGGLPPNLGPPPERLDWRSR